MLDLPVPGRPRTDCAANELETEIIVNARYRIACATMAVTLSLMSA
ncbi:hypothetical protein [Paraburkholderia ferrariae]|nr:hypothetical protein [Paraburkholderia ferrariae]